MPIFLTSEHWLLTSFALLDPKGQTVASTLTQVAAELPDASDRDFYLGHQRPSDAGVFIGQAVKSRISGLWIIPVSIRLEGRYNGYLMAAVDPEYFQRLYQTIDTGDRGFVTLFTTQGWAIARWPFNSEIAETNWLNSPMFAKEIAGSTDAVLRQTIAASGVDSLYSYRALSDFPLVVTLGISLEDALQPWHERVVYEGAGLLLFLLALGSTTVMLMRQLRARRQAEAALQLSEISVLKSTLPTLWIGRDARVLRVNRAACDLHGSPEQELLGMRVQDLNPAMTDALWPAHWERLRHARSMRFETMHRNRSGVDMPVEVDLNFIEFDGEEYNFSFIRDLTVRKQAEAEVQRSAALMRSAIDAVDEAFVLFDAEDRMVYCNAKYAQLYPGLEDVVVPGARFEDMVREGAQRGLYRESIGREDEWVAERMRSHRAGNETRVQELDDGRVLRVIDRRTPEGGFAGIRVDITDMVRATEAAQEASRYKSQFLANMSHEIRTPMNAILGLLALLQNTPLSASQRDYASKTEGAAQSLLHLLNDILDFSKVEAGKMELDLQPFRLDRMLRDIAVILSSNMAGKNIELLFDIDPQVPADIVNDAMRLQQVLVNLGGNAIKFTDRGQVVLRVRNLSMPEHGQKQQALIEFAIEDTGIGIAAEQQQHIFSGFSQAEASTTRRFGGTGLGLAISQRLVDLMGGQLKVQSTPGQGSTFSFALCMPLAQAGPQAPRLSQEVKRVLVVDDNPVALEILSSMTRSWSWQTETANGGVAALALIRSRLQAQEFPFDVIYLDWQMPGMDGWETASRIRALTAPYAVQPRICMLSANASDSLHLRTAQEQALVNAFLFKPVTASALHDAILEHSGSVLPFTRAQRSSERPLAGLRILVVEDNLINQQVAEELLNAEGALVSLAANGALGVSAVAASHPPFDVVLMDIQMPVLDGYAATRKIRQELKMVDLPIVAMTANAMATDRQACLQAGMNEHVGKPFDMNHLVAVLLRATGRQSQGDGAIQAAPACASDGEMAAPNMQGSADMFCNPYLDVAPALERISGLTSLYVDISHEFIRALDAVEADFRQAAQPGQQRTLVAQMHTLKGTAATLGAGALSAQAASLEALFKRAEADTVPLEHLPALLDLVQLTKRSVQDAVASMQGIAVPQAAGQARSGPLEQGQAKAFLRQLAELLGASNLQALDHFAARGAVLDCLVPAQLEELQLALRGLDLDLARQLCQRYIAAMD
jgi:PAS domain S-box-containing protein